MSDKLPMMALDKVAIRVAIPVKVKIKLIKIMKKNSINNLSELCNRIFENTTKDVELSFEDLLEVDEIIKRNIGERNRRKREKGLL